MSTVAGSRSVRDEMGSLSWIGVGLAILLGIAYLPLAASEIPKVEGIAFLLAALGYFGAVALVVTGYRRRQVYTVGTGYNALLIVLYFLINGVEISDLIGYAGVVKLGQVLFIVLLAALLARLP